MRQLIEGDVCIAFSLCLCDVYCRTALIEEIRYASSKTLVYAKPSYDPNNYNKIYSVTCLHSAVIIIINKSLYKQKSAQMK